MGFTCCICHEELYYRVKKAEDDKTYERPIVATKCGHLFHNYCLRNWFASQGAEVWTSRECPVCKMTLTVATDLIRIFSSSADEGGPCADDLKMCIQKLESDKKELIKRLELNFLQSRDAQKLFDQYKRENERMVEQLRKRQSENSKLKVENDDLKNVVINLTKSFTSGNAPAHQPVYRERERVKLPPPQNNYIHANVPPRFRPQPQSNINGKIVREPFPQQDHNFQVMPTGISATNSGNNEDPRLAYSNLQLSRGSDFNRMVMDDFPDMKQSSPTESESASDQGEGFDSKIDKEVAAAMGLLSVNSINPNENSLKSSIPSKDNFDQRENEDDSNYYPRLSDFSKITSNNIHTEDSDTEFRDRENFSIRRMSSPSNEFLEALLNGSDEVEHVINEEDNEGMDALSTKNGSKDPTPIEPKTPYQGTKQCYGKYVCQKCNAKWGSSRSWANKPQMCLYCKTFVYPHAQAPLMSKDELEKKIHF